MREAHFQKRVTDMATRFGWSWWHVPSPMVKRGDKWVGARQAAGLPDLVMIHPEPRMILAELKGDGGSLSDKQVEFLKMAREVADTSYLWTNTALDTEIPRYDGQRMLGVYAWTPEDEPIIEQILRSRVLL